MRLWIVTGFYAASLLLFSGCGTKPTPKAEAVIDTTLPVVSFTENGYFADMNALAFEWQSIKDERVKGIYVYKAKVDANASDQAYYDSIENRFSTHYVDSKIEPDTNYHYYFATFSDNAQSQKSEIVTVRSLGVLESVSWIHSIANMPKSAKIVWRPHTNQRVKSYIIQRRTLEEDAWKDIAKIEGRLNAEYIDLNLKDNFVYKYRIFVLTYDNILSTPSEIVKVVTKELPKEVTNIVTTRDLPRKIQITWDQSTNKDFARYNVYRSHKVDGSYELIAKLFKNTFVDEIPEDAKSYFYRVSVVDLDDLESESDAQSIQGMTLSKPKPPVVLEAKLVGNKVQLLWNQVDARTKSYALLKSFKTGWFKEVNEEIEGITEKKYVDQNIEPNTLYAYKILAVDANGIKSEPSITIELKTPEGLESFATKNVLKQNNQGEKTPQTQMKSEKIIPVNDFN